MTQLFNGSNTQQIETLYRANNATVDMTFNDVIVNSITIQQGAIQASNWYNKTQRKAIPAPIVGNLTPIELDEYNANQNLVNYAVANNAVLSGQETYENKILAGQYGEASPNNQDVLFQVDMRDVPNNQWLMLYATSSVQFNPSIGVSVSNNGSDWDDLYQNGNYNVTATDYQGNDISGTGFGLTTTNAGLQGTPIWVKPPTRFIRFVDINGGGNSYAVTAYSSISPPRSIQEGNFVNQISNLNNTVSYLPDEDRLYRVLVASTGFAVGDIARRSSRSFWTQPGNTSFNGWSNDTQRTQNLTAPPLTNLIELNNAQDGQNVIRLVNTNTSVLLIKATNALIKSIYMDNLGALTYLGIHQGLSTAPVNGNAPTESYRIPANGSVSFDFDRVYTGQVYLTFSSTPGNITLASINKNLIVRFN